MFAYCNNSPVNFTDLSGNNPARYYMYTTTAPVDDTPYRFYMHTPVDVSNNRASKNTETTTAGYEKEYRTLTSGNVTTYKGAVVVRLPFGGDNAFSCGVIFLGNEIGSDNGSIQVLMHEYGHFRHLNQIGWASYIANVAVPSAYGSITGKPYDEYYSQPWELVADRLGGVNRTLSGKPYPYAPDAGWKAVFYWVRTVLNRGPA